MTASTEHGARLTTMTDSSKARSELLPCPFCGRKDIRFDCHGRLGRGIHHGDEVWSMCCYDCGATFPNRYRKELLVEVWNRRAPTPSHSGEYAELESDSRMIRISKLIADMTEIQRKFGDTCVYIRRGGMSWGAVALNREADDKERGIFDLQAQHDRDMLARAGQVERLIQDRNAERQMRCGYERERDAMREALEEVERRKPGVFPFIAAALLGSGSEASTSQIHAPLEPGHIEALIAICSTRPQPNSGSGRAWEDGARRGWRWALDAMNRGTPLSAHGNEDVQGAEPKPRVTDGSEGGAK